MGKILKKALPIVAGIGLIALSGGFGIPAVLKGTASTIARAVGSGLLLTGLSGLRKKPRIDVAADQGALLRIRKDPTAPRLVLYGKSATGGTLVYQEALGASNSDLYTVIALAGHEIESLESFEWDGTTITFTSNNADGDFNNFMFLYEHLGTDAQTVNSTLDAASAKWTSNHRLRGVAYIVLKLVWDRDKFPQGFLNPKATLKGRKVYDPRKDDTNGGTGPHRLTDQSTWEWSDNAVLCLVDYLRGIRVANSATTSYDGQIIAGMGIADSRINWSNIIAEADICDEQVNIKAGGTENRYTCNGWIDPSRSHRDNVEAILSSCAGVLAFQSGKWSVYVGTPRTAVKARTTDELIGGVSMQSKRSSRDMINSVRGVFPDAAKGYAAADFPPQKNATYITEDGEEELWLDLNLPMTTSGSTAQRLAKIALERARREETLELTFNLTGLQDTVMDAVTFDHPRLNINTQKFLIADWALKAVSDGENVGFVVEESLIEEDDSIYDWNETTDEVTIPAQGTQTRVNTGQQALSDLSGNLDDIADGATSGKVKLTALTSGEPDLAKAGVLNKIADNIAETGSRKWAGETGADKTIDHADDIVFRQATAPAHKAGRIWIDTNNLDISRSTGTVWEKIGTDDALRLGVNAPAEAAADKTSANTAAAITGQGALATQSSVDLATGEVTNKVADNIAETGSRKWAGESGADVTLTRLGGNLLANGGFETGDFEGWATPFGGASSSVVAAPSELPGSFSAELVVDAIADRRLEQQVPAGEGDRLLLFYQALRKSTSLPTKVIGWTLDWLDKNGTRIGSRVTPAQTTDTSDAEVQPIRSVVGPAPAGTVAARCQIGTRGLPAGTGAWFVDGCQVAVFPKTIDIPAFASPNALLAGIAQEQSAGGDTRILTLGMATGQANDQDTFTFSPARQNIPVVAFDPGGRQDDAGLTTPTYRSMKAINLSVSGFTAELKLKETVGGGTLRTDTGATTGGTQDFEMDKSQSAEAFDDNYLYQFDWTATGGGTPSEPDPGQITVGLFTDDGVGGWIQRGSKSLLANGDQDRVVADDTKQINVDGLGQHAGKEFGMSVVNTIGEGGSLDAFDSVKYTTSGAPATATLTPTDVPKIAFTIFDGEESTVS